MGEFPGEDLSSSIIAGSTPAVCSLEHIASCLVAAGNGIRNGVRKHAGTFCHFVQLLSQKQKKVFLFAQSNEALALPENGYRASSVQAKSLSFRLHGRPLKFLAAGVS